MTVSLITWSTNSAASWLQDKGLENDKFIISYYSAPYLMLQGLFEFRDFITTFFTIEFVCYLTLRVMQENI